MASAEFCDRHARSFVLQTSVELPCGQVIFNFMTDTDSGICSIIISGISMWSDHVVFGVASVHVHEGIKGRTGKHLSGSPAHSLLFQVRQGTCLLNTNFKTIALSIKIFGATLIFAIKRVGQ